MDKTNKFYFICISLLYLIMMNLLITFSRKEHNNRFIKGYNVFVYPNNEKIIINKINNFLYHEKKKIPKKIGQLCILDIENKLNNLPFVNKSEVFISIDGIIYIKIYKNNVKL